MTPIRRQYLDVKHRYPGAIVLFRLGDFYETFDEDADLCARELHLTLTSRPLGKGERVPMAGIPHHALNGYLARLIARGHRVAICEQVGDPATSKGLVAREVTRVVSPGTVLTDDLLKGSANNFLAAYVTDGRAAGLAHADVSTGEFATAELPLDALEVELARLSPAELVLPADGEPPEGWEGPHSRCSPVRDPARVLLEHFNAVTLAAFGCERLPLATAAAATLISYLRETQPRVLEQVTRLRTYDARAHMTLDAQTRRNLELFEGGRSGERTFSLCTVLDRTATAMGARLLRARLSQPLLDCGAIHARLEAVAHLHADASLRAAVRTALGNVPDLERLLTRTAAGAASPRDLAALRRGLDAAAALRCVLAPNPGPLPALADCADAAALVTAAIAEDAPATLEAGGAIRSGYNIELDETRGLASDARGVLAALERRERERTGIKSLRVTYNRVFGYAIEVTNANLPLVPDDYQRRQTLSGGERFITAELKELESRVLGAQERISALEAGLFRDLCARVATHGPRIRALATALAEIDLSACHAETAAVRGYCQPLVDDGDIIDIKDGRHPVVEHVLASGEFVANDTVISAEAQITVLTGPNMAGKSTYLRQVALIVLMAQTGCFVPATSARIGLVDRIFTRVGAHDDLAAGNSTFMVEMVETAQILHHATPRSLVVLDEVGRGTSTYDGLAIARAVVEYLHNQRAAAARTLFATHYHELTALAATLPRVRNASVAVIEQDGEVVFLHRIVSGGADRSYGVHVARLAGLPRAVVQRAGEILLELESGSEARSAARGRRRAPDPRQLGLFLPAAALLDQLAALDVDALSPLEALTRLYELRERARAEVGG